MLFIYHSHRMCHTDRTEWNKKSAWVCVWVCAWMVLFLFGDCLSTAWTLCDSFGGMFLAVFISTCVLTESSVLAVSGVPMPGICWQFIIILSSIAAFTLCGFIFCCSARQMRTPWILNVTKTNTPHSMANWRCL